MRLLIVATHPIQYHVPLFRALANSPGVDLVVAFLDLPDAARQGVGFGVSFEWDVPLLDGYRWVALDSRVDHADKSQRFAGRRLPGARGQIRALAPDVVLVMGWNQLGLLQAWIAARSLGIPLVVRGESNAKRSRAYWKRLLHRALLLLPDAYIAIGASNRKFYLDSGVAASRIVDGPYFVDNESVSSRAEAFDRASARSAFGIPSDRCCVLFAGKFEAKKRPADLLAAAAALRSDLRSSVHLLMVGAGVLEEQLRTQAVRSRLQVTWAGFLNQSEIPKAYRAADVLVLPSDHGETWGLVVNEAAACGVPAIVGNQVGCADDLVMHGQTGWIFPTADVDTLGHCLGTAVSEHAMRLDLGRSARARVTQLYTVQKSAQAVVAIATALLQGRRPAPTVVDRDLR